MPDAGTDFTDKTAAGIERRLRRIYRDAQKEIIQKLDEQAKAMNAMDVLKRAQVASGKLTEQQYKDWLMGQMFTQQQWKNKVDSVATTLLNANRQANAIVEGSRMAIFGENANFAAYSLEHDLGMDVGFSLYDRATVTRLIREQPELLPRRIVNGEKDIAWNRKQISDAVAQGIIQGDSIPDIAKRIARQTCSSNEKAMVRYARTAVTGAQNAGRVAAMEDAQEMGIEVKKRWDATLDKRTRDAHADLDGQTVDADEPFTVDFDGREVEIMYPGDASCDEPGMVYNCRCTLGWVYPKYQVKRDRRDNETGERIGDMTYKEWKAAKGG